jgi:predicted metal-dependent hydrolase
MMLSLLKKRTAMKQKAEPRQAWLDVDGVDVPVIIAENSRSRRLTLRIVPGGKELRLSAPPKTPYREIDAFLYKHRNWVAARLLHMPEVQQLIDGVKIPLRGVPHRIVHQGRDRGLGKVVECDGELQIHVFGDVRHLSRRVVDFLKKQARADLVQAVDHHGSILGVKAKSITLRDTTSRWGSCSSSGALSFSWRIILAPPNVLDYLAAHEVAHLREMNHSPRFWKLVEETCPHTQTSKAWLKAHGSTLHAIVV